MTKIKICGLTRPSDIEAANLAKPDYIGFVFAESRRQVTARHAGELRGKLNSGIIPVGVFVNEAIENILAVANAGTIEIIQLHGGENEDYICELKRLTDKPIIKAVGVRSKDGILRSARTAADFLLLDNPGGGTGQSFDWGLIGKTEKPFFLAGGLHVNNVTDAISITAPFAVDTSSGVETGGVKDSEKIYEFIRRVRHG